MLIWSDDYRLAACVSYHDFLDYYCVRKPHNVATTFGLHYSFLDYLCDELHNFDPWLQVLLSASLFLFGRDGELWLLNRLDEWTAWYLYFAKTSDFFVYYRNKHREGLIYKYYSADVIGYWSGDSRFVCSSLYHHRYEKDRMVVFKSSHDERRIRGKCHDVETYCILLEQHEWWASLLIIIRHWIRHQIRAHLSSIGYPILWDLLYWSFSDTYLHLWSFGCEIY